MSRHLRDLRKLLDHAIYETDYGVPGSPFWVCRICEHESGAGLLARPGWHATDCPVPRLLRKYARKS